MSEPRRFTLARTLLLAYAAPGLPLAALTLPVYILLPAFYANAMGLGLAAVGTALLAARIWDAVSDPLIGYLSDKTKTRLGRRLPWIIGSSPLVLLGTWQLLLPPDGATLTHLIVWSIVLYTGWTGMVLPLSAMGAEITEDYHERSRVSGFREGAILAGTLIALTLAGAFGAGDPARAGEALGAIGWSVLIVLPIAVVLISVTLGRPEMVAKMEPPAESRLTLKQRFLAIGRNAPFKRLMTAFLINAMANGLPATLFVFYVETVLKRPDLTGPLLFGYFLTSVLAVPLWLWLSYRFGKHRIWCVAMFISCICFLPAAFLGEGDTAWFVGVVVLTGLCLGADLTLPASMQADVVDVDTAETGERRAGLFFAAWSMANKIALALAVGITFPLLQLAGFDTDAVAQTDQALLALALLYAVAPIGFKIIAIGLIWRHPLDEQRVKTLREQPGSVLIPEGP
ncbi:MAG: MFS transporter [Pseudomonadota bacterium]